MPLFHSGPATCPLDEDRKASIDRQLVWLRDRFGHEAVTRATLVLPTREFFPRAGERSDEEIEDTFQRIAACYGIPSESVGLSLYEPDEEPLAEYLDHWESHGAAGVFHAASEPGEPRYRIGVRLDKVDEPPLLIAVLAHELAHARLHEHLAGNEDDLEMERLTDLATVFFGLGIFTANAILQEHKGHNPWIEGAGWSIGRLGYLRGPEFGYALAVFAWWRGDRTAGWRKYLRKDVESPFTQTLRYFQESGSSVVPGMPAAPPA